jgi:hypothetical protein
MSLLATHHHRKLGHELMKWCLRRLARVRFEAESGLRSQNAAHQKSANSGPVTGCKTKRSSLRKARLAEAFKQVIEPRGILEGFD